MASPIRQVQNNNESNAGASPAHGDASHETSAEACQHHDWMLLKVLAEVSGDPARLRRLFDAMNSRNPRLDIVLAEPMAHVAKRAKTILELEQMLHLERTIKRVEAQPKLVVDLPHPVVPTSAVSEPSRGHASGRMPRPLDAAGPVGMQAEAPIQEPYALRLSIRSFLQVSAATVIGAAVFLGISGWIHWARPMASQTARANPPRLPPSEVLPGAAETVGSAQPRRIEPPPALPNKLPFPRPVSYGVYAGSNGQLIELEPLPVEVPVSRARMSAEITKPSRVTLPGDKLSFVIFRRNLANDVPAAVSARVVGRVSRAIAFVNLTAKVTPLENSWRIRDKSYEFKVSPVEGSREMFVVRPDADLPAGRYALVLSGYGYDFNVAGPITALEQCLEQTQVTNGILVTECPG
jgi:hypothetical protein